MRWTRHHHSSRALRAACGPLLTADLLACGARWALRLREVRSTCTGTDTPVIVRRRLWPVRRVNQSTQRGLQAMQGWGSYSLRLLQEGAPQPGGNRGPAWRRRRRCVGRGLRRLHPRSALSQRAPGRRPPTETRTDRDTRRPQTDVGTRPCSADPRSRSQEQRPRGKPEKKNGPVCASRSTGRRHQTLSRGQPRRPGFRYYPAHHPTGVVCIMEGGRAGARRAPDRKTDGPITQGYGDTPAPRGSWGSARRTNGGRPHPTLK